jgi:chemotaxis protein methyltransferase CheR
MSRSEINVLQEYELTDREFAQFRDFIYKTAGISLSDAKKQLVRSRLQKRLRTHGLSSYQQYFDMVVRENGSGTETTALINCVTTNKTDFFREPHHFDYIRKTVVPQIVQRSRMTGAPHRITAWHAGCSTGEEPYTLGITMQEALKAYPGWSYGQLASDIDTNVLASAQDGIYSADRVETIPNDLRSKYFTRLQDEDGLRYRVLPTLREPITFRQVNLTIEPWPINPTARFDIIFCRNVIIYFDRPTQQKLFRRFASILKPGGYLFIGHSESLHGVSEAYENLGKTIYRLPAAAELGARAA